MNDTSPSKWVRGSFLCHILASDSPVLASGASYIFVKYGGCKNVSSGYRVLHNLSKYTSKPVSRVACELASVLSKKQKIPKDSANDLAYSDILSTTNLTIDIPETENVVYHQKALINSIDEQQVFCPAICNQLSVDIAALPVPYRLRAI